MTTSTDQNSGSSERCSQPTKQPASSISEHLTDSEIQSLRQEAKEADDYFRRELEKRRKKTEG